MYIWKSRYLRRAEIWFDEEPGGPLAADWISYNQRSQPVPGPKWRPFYTYAVDLSPSVEQLQARLSEGTAYKIRRARERDKITCECYAASDLAARDQFEEMYNSFAAAKGLQPLERARIDSMAFAGGLELSVAKDAQGKILVFHGNYRSRARVSQTYSASLFRSLPDSSARNLVSRAHRYLVWSDMLRYRKQGLKYFDFCGWYPGTSDESLLRINEFKAGFGGEVLRDFSGEQILTLKGWLVLTAAKWLERIKAASPDKPRGAADSSPPAAGETAASPAA